MMKGLKPVEVSSTFEVFRLLSQAQEYPCFSADHPEVLLPETTPLFTSLMANR